MKNNTTIIKLGGGYYAVFEGNGIEPKIVYRKKNKKK